MNSQFLRNFSSNLSDIIIEIRVALFYIDKELTISKLKVKF